MKEIGKGGFGQVFKVQVEGKECALKLILLPVIFNEENGLK